MKPLLETLLIRAARRLARAWMPRSFWPIVDDDLRDELAQLERDGKSRPWLAVWGAAQYLLIAGRLVAERVTWEWPRAEVLRGGWGLDFRQAWRGIRRQPDHSLSVILTIAIAVGAMTSVYSVVDGVLLQPLPYPEPDRLVRIWQTRAEPLAPGAPAAHQLPTNAPIYFDWLRSDVGFEALGAYGDAAFVLQADDGARVIKGQEADSGLFDALAVEPLLGRGISPKDDVPEIPEVVVLSESLWRTRFGSRHDILGTKVVLDRIPHTVIGVMPRDFRAPVDPTSDGLLAGQEPLLWTPLTAEAKRGDNSVAVLARLAADSTLENVQSRFQTVHSQLVLGHGEWQRGNGVRLEGLLESMVGEVRSTLWFLLGAVGLVMLVAIVNITNLLAAQSLTRGRDLAVRSALGAGIGRLVRGRVVESTVLACLGGLAGIAMAWWLLPTLLQLLPPSLPRQEWIGMNPRVFLGAVALTGVTALLVAAFPSLLAARTHPERALRSSARGATGGRAVGKVRSTLVIAEVSVAFVLLIGAGLLLSSFERLWSVDRGFSTAGLVGIYLLPDFSTLPDRESQRRFHSELRATLDQIPGVRASAVNNLPLSGRGSGTMVYLERGDAPPLEAPAQLSVGLEDALPVVGVRMWAGRSFDHGDSAEAPAVAIVNRTLADTYWPAGDAIGQRLSVYDSPETSREIVGIAEDVRHQGLAHGVQPEVYLPAAQSDRVTQEWVLRVEGDTASAIAQARRAIASVSPTTAVRRVLVLDEAIEESVAMPRFRTFLVAMLASLAGVLALLGVYGVLAYSVAQQRLEIGVRMALGAGSGRVIADIVGSGLRLVLTGLGIGWLVAWGLADVLRSFLFEVAPGDPRVFGAVAACVLVVGALAALLPARSAASVSPVEVLDR